MKSDGIYLACMVTCGILVVITAMEIIPPALCAVLCMFSFVSTFSLLSNKNEDEEL